MQYNDFFPCELAISGITLAESYTVNEGRIPLGVAHQPQAEKGLHKKRGLAACR